MTVRLRVIGNSHVAAIRRGWSTIEAGHPGVSVDFFAAHSTLFDSLELDGDKRFGMHRPSHYKPQHRDFLTGLFGGLTTDLTDADAVLLVGQGIREKDFLRQMLPYSIDGLREVPDSPRLLRPAFEAFADAIFERGMPGPEWRGWTMPRLYLLAPPIPVETAPGNDRRYRLWHRFGAEEGPKEALFDAYYSRVAAILARAGITLIIPPSGVLAANGLTRAEFREGAGRLDGALGAFEDDYHHMNARYGALAFDHALERVEADFGVAAAPAVEAAEQAVPQQDDEMQDAPLRAEAKRA